jgi:hypothetical protein
MTLRPPCDSTHTKAGQYQQEYQQRKDFKGQGVSQGCFAFFGGVAREKKKKVQVCASAPKYGRSGKENTPAAKLLWDISASTANRQLGTHTA